MNKIVDVCEKISAAGCLKKYYEKNNIENYKIISMGLNLSIGDIKNNHLSFLRKLYNEETYDYNVNIQELLNNINETTKVRIWASLGNDDDYLLLLYICNLLNGKCNNISVIYTTDYNKYALSLNCCDYKEVNKLLEYEQQLTKEDINNFSDKFKRVVQDNSELRVLKDGVIENKKYSDYYEIIIEKLREFGRCTIARLIGNLMVNRIINDSIDTTYLYIIDKLIAENKIKIVETGDRHFVDIIEIAN